MILYNSIKIIFVYTRRRGGEHDCIKLRKVITVDLRYKLKEVKVVLGFRGDVNGV